MSVSAPARAEPEASEADTLFEQGRARMAAGDYAGACQKFDESYRLEPANGTRLGLALCHEEQGMLATALNEFLAVAAASRSDGHSERGAVARKHIAALGPRVSKLTFDLAPETRALTSLELECDGVHVDTASSADLPVEPGSHVIVATAPEHARWTANVQIGARPERVVVAVPALAPSPPPAVVPPSASSAPPPAAVSAPSPRRVSELSRPAEPPAASSPLPTRRVLGLVIAGLGVVAVGVGAAEGLHATSENDQARARCPSSPCASPSGVALSHSALDAATASDILFGVGAVALGVGAYLWWKVPRTPVAVNVGLQRAEVRLQW